MASFEHLFSPQRFRVLTYLIKKLIHLDIFDFIVVMGVLFFLPVKVFSVIQINDLLLFFLALIMIFYVIKQFRNFYFAKEHLLMSLYALWAFFTYWQNPLREGIFACWSMYLMPCILFISLSQVIFLDRKEKGLEKGLMIWGLFIAVQLIISIFWAPDLNLSLHFKANTYWARSNFIAAILEPAIIWCYHLIHEKNAKKNLAIFTFAFCIFALVLTLSRGGIITIALSLLLYSLLRKRYVSILVTGIIAVVFYPIFAGRFMTFLDSGNMDRIYLWVQSIDLILKNPFFGFGPGNIPLYATLLSSTDFMTDPHNFIFAVLLHTGFPGFIVFAWLMAIFIRRALRINKYQKNPFFVVVIFSAFFHGFVEPTFLGEPYSFLFWYCMVMLLVQSERVTRRQNGVVYSPTK
jgi:O-antigen ligase